MHDCSRSGCQLLTVSCCVDSNACPATAPPPNLQARVQRRLGAVQQLPPILEPPLYGLRVALQLRRQPRQLLRQILLHVGGAGRVEEGGKPGRQTRTPRGAAQGSTGGVQRHAPGGQRAALTWSCCCVCSLPWPPAAGSPCVAASCGCGSGCRLAAEGLAGSGGVRATGTGGAAAAGRGATGAAAPGAAPVAAAVKLAGCCCGGGGAACCRAMVQYGGTSGMRSRLASASTCSPYCCISWRDTLLPRTAHRRCRARVKIVTAGWGPGSGGTAGVVRGMQAGGHAGTPTCCPPWSPDQTAAPAASPHTAQASGGAGSITS